MCVINATVIKNHSHLMKSCLPIASGNTSDKPNEFNVSISVNYTSPSSFDRTVPYYRAASPISLTCQVEGVSGEGVFSPSSLLSGDQLVWGTVLLHGKRQRQ